MNQKFVEALAELLKVNRKLHELHGKRLDALEDEIDCLERGKS